MAQTRAKVLTSLILALLMSRCRAVCPKITHVVKKASTFSNDGIATNTQRHRKSSTRRTIGRSTIACGVRASNALCAGPELSGNSIRDQEKSTLSHVGRGGERLVECRVRTGCRCGTQALAECVVQSLDRRRLAAGKSRVNNRCFNCIQIQ